MSEPIVDLLAVEKVFKDFWGRARVRALEPLSFSLAPGEILGLLGPNGAGKSTTIKLILGLLFPSRGRIRVFGGPPSDPEVRARVGYLPEETRLHKFLNARETLDLFGRLHGVPPRERRRRTEELIAMVGLRGNEERPVGEFSKGMARRIGLAVALAGDPDLVVLDEPTSGLDPLGTREIKDFIAELRRRGRTVLLTSHLLDDVEDVADRVAILYGGKLQRLGRTSELLAQRGRVRIELDRPDELDREDLERRIRAALPAAEGLELSTPSARLETLFRQVVAEAVAAQANTSGAQTGGPLAGFIGGGAGVEERPGPAPRAPTAEPEPRPPLAEGAPAEASAGDRPRVEALTADADEAAPAPAGERGRMVLEALLQPPAETAAPAPEPVAPDASAEKARDVLAALTREPAEPPPAAPAAEDDQPAPREVDARARAVLERLVRRPDREAP